MGAGPSTAGRRSWARNRARFASLRVLMSAGGCLVPLFVETNNHLGVSGFFQVCAVGDEFVAVLDVSVLATGEGIGESDAGLSVVGIDVLNVFGEGAPPCFECGVALAIDFAGLNDVGAVCEDVPVLDVRGVLFIGARDGLGGFCGCEIFGGV